MTRTSSETAGAAFPFGKLAEQHAGTLNAVDVQHDRETLRRHVTLWGNIRAHEFHSIQSQRRVDDAVAPFDRDPIGHRRFAVGHERDELAAEQPLVLAERRGALAVETQMDAELK